MVFGISSFTYGWAVGVPGSLPPNPLSEMGLVEKTLKAGFTCLQIGDNLPLHMLSLERLEHLRRVVDEKDIRLEVGARKLTREHLNRYIDIAGLFKSPLLRFVVDGQQYEPDSNEIIQVIREAVPRLKEHNLILGIENHDRFKAKDLAFIMLAVNSDHVGICLDCVNSLGAGEGLEWVSSTLIPYTVNLHVKDFIIKRLPHQMGFTVSGAPLGKGMIQLPQLLEQVSKYNRCQSAVLEQWVSPEEKIEDTIRKEEEWAHEGIEYLKKFSSFSPDDLS